MCVCGRARAHTLETSWIVGVKELGVGGVARWLRVVGRLSHRGETTGILCEMPSEGKPSYRYTAFIDTRERPRQNATFKEIVYF